MALNFDKIISENENVSLEDLPIESLVQTDLDTNSNMFNKLFEDHFSILLNQNGKDKLLSETMDKSEFFDLDLDCIDIEYNIEKNIELNEPLPNCYINLIDFVYEPKPPEIYPDSDEIFSINGSDEADCNKKNTRVTRRQSTRIQDQTRKKIAEQIQRENIRLAKEAERLNNKDYSLKNNNNEYTKETINDSSIDAYLLFPTDLDAEDELKTVDVEWKTDDDDPYKLWCICKQPYDNRFMICCDNCSEWYHGDCVGITQEEGARMEDNGQDFMCPLCDNLSIKKDSRQQMEPVVISDDDDDEELLNCDGDDDCRIIKSVKAPTPSNIFQIFKSAKSAKATIQRKIVPMTLSARTSVCLNFGCKTLVNPKKSLYCSRKCIEKYTKTVCKNNQKEKVAQYGLVKGTKLAKITRFVLAQPETDTIQDEFDAPTEENLKEFLLKNPTYKVFQSSKAKVKQDPLKTKKVVELLTQDAAKRVKVVKHFSLIIKKIVPKSSQIVEFRSIWQQCVKLEEALFTMCEKTINDRYKDKVKELSEIFRQKFQNRMSLDFIQEKMAIADLLAVSKDQIDGKCGVPSADGAELKLIPKNGKSKKSTVTNKMGFSSLLSDTTHMHGQHLYDINCKICNGTSKNNNEKIPEKNHDSEKEIIEIKDNETEKVPTECSELETVRLPTDSCTSESIVTSWFSKSCEVSKNPSPVPLTNDEFKVTSTVETPDMAIDMELCSTPSISDQVEVVNGTKSVPNDAKIDSSASPKLNKTPIKSTNNKPGRQKLSSLWEGEILYKDVGSIFCKSYLVSRRQLGKSKEEIAKEEPLATSGDNLRKEINLAANLTNQIKINGRLNLSVVQDYLKKLHKRSNKEFLVFRLHPMNLEEGRNTYLKMFEFFHSKDRCGVIDQKRLGLKDCFIYPLNAHAKVPSFCYPINGPGFEKRRPHLLLMLVVRTPLEHSIYKSFSPKYDQNHDFATNHGINLEKYCNPATNPSMCPSPIPGFVAEDKVTNGLTLDDTLEIPLEEENNEPPNAQEEMPSVVEPSTIPELPVISDSLKSLFNTDDNQNVESIINTVHKGISSHTIDFVVKEPMDCAINFDPLFIPSQLVDSDIPFVSHSESNIIQSEHVEDRCFSADIDLRLLSTKDSVPHDSHQSLVNSDDGTFSNGFSSLSQLYKRHYTFYDAYFDDPNFEMKRAKYFFNPRLPNNRSSQSSYDVR